MEQNSLDDSMVALEKAVPCLLHLENRGSEGVIGFVFLLGLSIREENTIETESYITAVTTIINEELFGEPRCPSNWVFPLDDNGGMGEIKFANWRARKIVEEMDSLIDVSFPGDERANQRDKWKEAVLTWRAMIKVCLLSFFSFFFNLRYTYHLPFPLTGSFSEVRFF